MDPLEPQPPPTGDGPEVWPAAIAYAQGQHAPIGLLTMMRARDRQGRERYGTPLRMWNGRDACVDALQEALDLYVYLVQVNEEVFAGPPGSTHHALPEWASLAQYAKDRALEVLVALYNLHVKRHRA